MPTQGTSSASGDKLRVSVMIDRSSADYIESICKRHGDMSRWYNVALKNLITELKKIEKKGLKDAKKSKPGRTKGITNSNSGRKPTGR